MTEPHSSPDDRMMRLNAALDDELDAANWLELEREMTTDPALAAQYRLLVATRDAVRRHAPREAAPAALAGRIAGLVAKPAPVQPRRRWTGTQAVALAAALAVLGYALGVGLTALQFAGAPNGVASALVSDFARGQIAGQPFDVASSDRHTVKPWLAGRTTVSAEIVDLAAQGFSLAGGRVAIVDRIPAPTLVYRHNEHLVAVTELPLDAAAAGGGGAIETIDGFRVARWADANLRYVAVSDMDEKTLAEFVADFRQARKPVSEGSGK